ncbi:MAG: glycosyltransferase family 2 protein [Deltaproteobacteria bacterium]|nr:glycosyltransferase family 2 protein [Deltaproteobacteria bacterium]
MRLSVLIPVYNERKRIRDTIKRVIIYFENTEPDFELILINDGSTDETLQICVEQAGAEQRIRVISYPVNRGKGYAILRGLKAAQGELLLFMDADMATPLKEYLKLREIMFSEKLDLVLGARVKDETDIAVHNPIYRRFVGRIFNMFVRMIVLPHIKDSQCGFKLYTRSAYQAIASRQVIHDFSFDVEHLYITRKLGLKIKEVGVQWSNVANTTVSVFRSALPMLINLFRIRWHHRRGY